ncbi:putative metal-nicotianamine transporter YSL8 [Frankliniella fusca]|uniref:Metal-nicotianamine transporter YSL8 n=1 Tax=Frankliniella fusca TaxID=407009 RepID=A0AAE1LA16_9NEOP|nr:putative metal-nicotianamine transporter YSL8 [Frankliniella fusca]
MKTHSVLLLLALVLAGCATAALARAANDTDRPAAAASAPEQSGEDLDDGDVDFPEEQGPQRSEVAPPPRRQQPPTPVSVYVFRLLEILTGAESFGKHTRFARQADGYPASIDLPEAPRANTAASYSNYYDFLINEGSYKFWAVFQIGTAVLLTYSAFAALYYARYTYYTNVDYTDYDDYFFRRSGNSRSQRSAPFAGLSSTEYQRVMDAAGAGSKFKSDAKSSS